MLTQMDVGGAMACTHNHVPPGKPIPPMVPSAVHECTPGRCCAGSRSIVPAARPELSLLEVEPPRVVGIRLLHPVHPVPRSGLPVTTDPGAGNGTHWGDG